MIARAPGLPGTFHGEGLAAPPGVNHGGSHGTSQKQTASVPVQVDAPNRVLDRVFPPAQCDWYHGERMLHPSRVAVVYGAWSQRVAGVAA